MFRTHGTVCESSADIRAHCSGLSQTLKYDLSSMFSFKAKFSQLLLLRLVDLLPFLILLLFQLEDFFSVRKPEWFGYIVVLIEILINISASRTPMRCVVYHALFLQGVGRSLREPRIDLALYLRRDSGRTAVQLSLVIPDFLCDDHQMCRFMSYVLCRAYQIDPSFSILR